MIGGTLGVVLVVVAAVATTVALNRSDADLRWSAFPNTVSCREQQDELNSGLPTNTRQTVVTAAALSHSGEQNLAVTLDFAAGLPSTSFVASPYTDKLVPAPGTYTFMVYLSTSEGLVTTVLTKDGWGATRIDLASQGVEFPVDIVTSVDTSSRSIRFEYDLQGQPQLFGDGPFTPDVRILASRAGSGTPSDPTGGGASYKDQLCSWGSSSRSSYPTGAPAAPSADASAAAELPSGELVSLVREALLEGEGGPIRTDSVTCPPEPASDGAVVRCSASTYGDEPQSIAVTPRMNGGTWAVTLMIEPSQPQPPAADVSTSCGVSEDEALAQALSQLPPESNTGREWASEPTASNFDACADLSTILVTVNGATGSSPVQALMFHRGQYLGTGTSEAYGFTDLDSAASTSDTVVLTYETGQTCNACDDGVTTSVRYRWDGRSVQMLDPPPS